jgi:DMSO/TMAO reductase YedYZ heme-binding membrane subunit
LAAFGRAGTRALSVTNLGQKRFVPANKPTAKRKPLFIRRQLKIWAITLVLFENIANSYIPVNLHYY